MALKNKKEDNFSEWYTELVGETGAHLADTRYGIQGAIVETPWTVKIIRAFEKMIEDNVEADGHEPMLFPTIVPESYIKIEKDHVKGFAPALYWITKGGKGKKTLDKPYYLRPTGESQIYPLYSLWVRSWKELPMKRYQSRMTVFRFESTTRPFLRGREFNFFETHNVYANHNDVLKQIKLDMKYTKNVLYNNLGIPFIFFKRPEWDKFAGAIDTFASDSLLPNGKAIQIASTHDFGQKFSKTYNIKFKNKNEKDEYAWQTAYGPGIIRYMAALVAIHGDNYGLVLPFNIAPIQVVIVPIIFGKTEKIVDKKCKQVEAKLKKMGYKVKYDNSDNKPGWKFNQWEMMGVPIRIEIGPKDIQNKKITIKSRVGKKAQISEKDLKKTIDKLSTSLLKTIKSKADKWIKSQTRNAKNYSELKKILKKEGGFVKVNWCSMEKDGEKCADKLQKENEAAEVRGLPYGKEEAGKGKCVMCGKKAKHTVYIAKSY